MRKVVGILLVALGMFATLPAALTLLRPPPPGADPVPYRIGQAIGGAVCVLVPFVGGVSLLLTDGKKPRRRRDDYDDEDDEYDDRPRRRRRRDEDYDE